MRSLVVSEQIRWWKAEGFTPPEAMEALGFRPALCQDCSWPEVEAAAQCKLMQVRGYEPHGSETHLMTEWEMRPAALRLVG